MYKCDMHTGKLVYNAQSPDEAALVSAARNFGFIFVVSDFHTVQLRVHVHIDMYIYNTYYT